MMRYAITLAIACLSIFTYAVCEEEECDFAWLGFHSDDEFHEWIERRENAQHMNFDTAVYLTTQFSPQLLIAESEAEATVGTKIQSRLLPNPVASYSVENILGNRTSDLDWRDWKSADSRYEIAQLIELGGKRGFRIELAKFQHLAAAAAYEATKLSVMNQLFRAFTLVVAAQENVEVTTDQTNIAEEVYKTVAAKVEAGKVSILQQNKAEIALATAQISRDKAEAHLLISRARLAMHWGDTQLCNVQDVVFPFYEIEVPRCLDDCLGDLETNPQLLASQLNLVAANANVKLERAHAIPDVTLLLGCKTLRDTGNQGMILGAAIPLPVFNRNQGNIYRARADATKSTDQVTAVELALKNRLVTSHRELIRAYVEAEKIRSTVLKAAEQSFELAQAGYREGKFEYLDMLDSQKTLFEIKERYIQALLNYHQRKADILYLTTQGAQE